MCCQCLQGKTSVYNVCCFFFFLFFIFQNLTHSVPLNGYNTPCKTETYHLCPSFSRDINSVSAATTTAAGFFFLFLNVLCLFKACKSFLLCNFLCFIVCLSMAPDISCNFPIPHIPYPARGQRGGGGTHLSLGGEVGSWSWMGDFRSLVIDLIN